MKRKSVFLDENTNLEIEEFLKSHQTLYVPVGATEQHGPHAAIGTDVFVPREIARRLCEREGNALVAPSLAYTLSYPHKGFTSEFSLSIETFMAMVKELALSFAKAGFKRIVFLNGHYDNTYALAYACAQAAETMPGLHAGAGEVSMLLAINPDLVDMEKANTEFPNFPETITNSPALHNAVFFSSPGSVYRMTKSGTWGDATKGTAEKEEEILEAGVQSVINLMADYEKTIEGLEIR